MDRRHGERISGVLPGFESPEDLPAPPEQPRKKRRRRTKPSILLVRALATLLSVATLGAVGTVWGTTVWVNGMVADISALDTDSDDIADPDAQDGDDNFLIAGSDTRAGAKKSDNVGDASSVPGARSDTLMLAHIPADRSRVVIVSFPRDLEVGRPECQRWQSGTGKYTSERVPGADQVKVNTAFEVGGPRCATRLVQRMTGLKINHFIGIDFRGFKGMVDAVGGVTVDVQKPIVDKTLGKIIDKPGVQGLTGDQALQFVRARKVAGDPTGDYGRIGRQQQFVSALLSKTISGEVMTNPDKIGAFARAFSEATVGENIDVDSLLTLGRSMQGMQDGAVKFHTIPTGGTNDRGNEQLDTKATDKLFRALIHDRKLPH